MSVGLVLEGGGMRGAFTAGALQMLHAEKIRFDYVIGVSAGALTALSFISDQPLRNYETFVKYAPDPRYVSMSNLAKKGSMFDWDFVLGEIVYDLLPFDFDAFFESPTRFVITTTDVNEGRPIYYQKESLRDDRELRVLRATASLPLIAPMVEFDGRLLLDGGIADPIPIEKSIADGNEYNVVILTRDREYTSGSMKNMQLLKAIYRDYPELLEVLRLRSEIYRRQREYIWQLEQEGKCIVICPNEPITIGKYEKNAEKLAALHDTAMFDTFPKIAAIREMLERHG